MYEIDKQSFAALLTKLRKEKGYTQKELAERVYVSDKAVSKWERGLSLPDVSLLIPLSQVLAVSVTELLQGQLAAENADMDPQFVEELVKKAINLSEPGNRRETAQKRLLIFLCAIGAAAIESILGWWVCHLSGVQTLWGMLTFGLLGAVFGIYIWGFMPETLPSYYDENRISYFSHGVMRMHVPGISLNNGTWKYMVKSLRIWSLVSVLTAPLLCVGVSLIPVGFGLRMSVQTVALLCYLGGLFVPVYVIGLRYGGKKQVVGRQKTIVITVLVAAIVLGVFSLFRWIPWESQVLQLGYVSSFTPGDWSASYVYLDGTQTKRMSTGESEREYVLEVETKSGSLSVTVNDENGQLIFREASLATGVYRFVCSGKVMVVIQADSHRGGFCLSPVS